MTTSALILIGIDLAAALVLSLGLYYRRHHRRDLVVAFLGVNVGVMAVAAVLGTAEVAMGLGLGLFGVLSIIRLRSSEITQREVAYYFAALAIGLLTGLPQTDPWPVAALVALILVVLWAADHPRLPRPLTATRSCGSTAPSPTRPSCGPSSRRRLGGTVTSTTVQELDLVNDTTLVDVRYRVPRGGTRPARGGGLTLGRGASAATTPAAGRSPAMTMPRPLRRRGPRRARGRGIPPHPRRPQVRRAAWPTSTRVIDGARRPHPRARDRRRPRLRVRVGVLRHP